MAKNKITKKTNTAKKAESTTTEKTEEATANSGRTAPKRKKVYERVREGSIPEKLQEHFRKDHYEIRLIRWSIQGQEDYSYLSRREREGYEFVTVDELPDWYKNAIRTIDTKGRKDLVIVGDLCLMKVDIDLRNSRRQTYEELTQRELNAVDSHVLEKKGFVTKGTRSTTMKSPNFQN